MTEDRQLSAAAMEQIDETVRRARDRSSAPRRCHSIIPYPIQHTDPHPHGDCRRPASSLYMGSLGAPFFTPDPFCLLMSPRIDRHDPPEFADRDMLTRFPPLAANSEPRTRAGGHRSKRHHGTVISISHGSSSSTVPVPEPRAIVGQHRFMRCPSGPPQYRGFLSCTVLVR